MHLEGFEVLTSVVMKSFISWDKIQCSPFQVKRRFEGAWRSWYLLRAGFLVRLFFEAGGEILFLRNVGTSVDFQRITWRYIPEDITRLHVQILYSLVTQLDIYIHATVKVNNLVIINNSQLSYKTSRLELHMIVACY
jgi:hypothetical protein